MKQNKFRATFSVLSDKDPIMKIDIGNFHLEINQRYLEHFNPNSTKYKHFWKIIGEATKNNKRMKIKKAK
jgi:hypothetical protein